MADGADDICEDGFKRFAGDGGPSEKDLIGPNGDFDLAVGLGVALVGMIENAVGDLVAELVGVAAQDGFAGTDHEVV